MPFCINLDADIIGVPIRNAVGFAFCHFFIHGIFVTAFVFSNSCYPPFYYVDYFYGISGAVLIFVSIIGILIASSKNWQVLRSLWAFVVVLNVLAVSAGSFYYTIMRWNDVMVTAFVAAVRKPGYRDFPDDLWYTSTVIACLMILPFMLYMLYITSYMCNELKSSIFTDLYTAYTAPAITLPQITQSPYYPTQK